MKLTRIVASSLLLCFGFSAMAGESGPQEGNLVISPLAVWMEHPGEIDVDDDDVAPGLAIGVALSDRWMVEALHFQSNPDFTRGSVSDDMNADSSFLNLMYMFPNEGHWQPYVTIGGGRTDYDFPRPTRDEEDNQYNAGVGFFSNLTKRIAVRGDVRGVWSHEADEFNPMATLGLSLMVGRMAPAEPPVPPDSDGDGVPDDRDRCPNTPPGTAVGPDGCERDQDGDGVADGRDRCPNTPAGAQVDDTGCPIDTDGDGVPDFRDECPGTEAGARVDQKGCYVELEETVTRDIQLEFDLNSAELRPGHYVELDDLVEFLRQYPTADAVIEGHTDSTGDAQYNERLSKQRADSVLRYLVDQGIPARRLRSVGRGEEQPIADNDTAEGRQLNRRVTAVVEATTTVRQ